MIPSNNNLYKIDSSVVQYLGQQAQTCLFKLHGCCQYKSIYRAGAGDGWERERKGGRKEEKSQGYVGRYGEGGEKDEARSCIG